MPLLVGLIVLLVAEAMKGLLLTTSTTEDRNSLVVRMVAILCAHECTDIMHSGAHKNRHHPHY